MGRVITCVAPRKFLHKQTRHRMPEKETGHIWCPHCNLTFPSCLSQSPSPRMPSLSLVSSTFSIKSFRLLYQTCINRKSSTFSVMDLWTALIGHSKCKRLLRPLHLKDVYPSTLRTSAEDQRTKKKDLRSEFKWVMISAHKSLVKRRSQEWTPWWKVTCLDIQKENGSKFVSQGNW